MRVTCPRFSVQPKVIIPKNRGLISGGRHAEEDVFGGADRPCSAGRGVWHSSDRGVRKMGVSEQSFTGGSEGTWHGVAELRRLKQLRDGEPEAEEDRSGFDAGQAHAAGRA